MLLIIPIHLRLTRIQVVYTRKRNSDESLVNIPRYVMLVVEE